MNGPNGPTSGFKDTADGLASLIDEQKRHLPFMRSPAHWDVLAILIQNRATPSMKSISLHANIDAKTASRIVAEFRDAGLIQPARHAGDRRFKKFELTERGRQKVTAYWDALCRNFMKYDHREISQSFAPSGTSETHRPSLPHATSLPERRGG